MRAIQPDKVFHLAALSNVMQSFEDPIGTFETNVMGTLHLFEATRLADINPVIQICSSSEVYGQVTKDDIPIKEKTTFYPINPYGVSKVAADRLSFQYFQSYGMKTVITRAFPHTGPRRSSAFAESSFAKQLVKIENGGKNTITVGNLDSVRTFLDVRDMVGAYWQAAEKCDFGEAYNIGSENPLTINELLSKLIDLSNADVEIKKDSSLLRPTDTSNHIPDTTKFKNKTGWKPKISLEQTLVDLLDYWRRHTKN